MRYQWGRKEPFTFATNSESNGIYPVKIYTIDGVLIYQEDRGSSNKDKQPIGGVIYPAILANSMMETIKKPITYYGSWSAVISQIGVTSDLWDHYWTSYSRGTDGYAEGSKNFINRHIGYLDGYTPQQIKSIYDPCPYGFKVPSNGTYNGYKFIKGWERYSFTGGVEWSIDNRFWLSGIGRRTSAFEVVGSQLNYWMSTIASKDLAYWLYINSDNWGAFNYQFSFSFALSVRCIEGLCSSVRSDRRTRC